MRDEILKLADELIKEHPTFREGQAVFNAAYMLYPKAANTYRGSRVDPFYNDDYIDTFLEVIEIHG
jgi:hypothetical protein